MNTASSAAATTTMGFRPPFTPLQWQELEHQALIFKYLMAGLPVPPDLVIPIKKSFESMSMSARFFDHPSMSYCSFYGKKVDPEPGRCRRTDGKKWRCSKDAYPDSKYCERHMHRGRNRSRKPVETQTMVQSSSTVTSLSTASGSSSVGGGGGLPLHSINNSRQGALCAGTNPSQLQMDSVPYGIGTKDYRYLQGMKQEGDEHSFLSDTSGSARSLEMNSSLDGSWHMMPSKVSSFPQSKSRNGSIMRTDYPEMQTLQDLGHTGITATLLKQQQQHCLFGGQYGLAEPGKPEGQYLRPFFDEWPKTRDSWSELEDDRSNRTSFSTTQLSISIPMASSDFSATSSQSPNDD